MQKKPKSAKGPRWYARNRERIRVIGCMALIALSIAISLYHLAETFCKD